MILLTTVPTVLDAGEKRFFLVGAVHENGKLSLGLACVLIIHEEREKRVFYGERLLVWILKKVGLDPGLLNLKNGFDFRFLQRGRNPNKEGEARRASSEPRGE